MVATSFTTIKTVFCLEKKGLKQKLSNRMELVQEVETRFGSIGTVLNIILRILKDVTILVTKDGTKLLPRNSKWSLLL